MKRLHFPLIALLLATVLSIVGTMEALAGHVTPEQAEQSARAFLDSRQRAGQSARLKMARRQPMTQASDNAAYYVFNVGEDAGFVMVSGVDRTPAILGYTDSGTFDATKLPADVRAWFDGYAEQLSYLERTEGRYEAPRVANSWEPVGPLLMTKWDQNSPFNDQCPIDPSTGNRSAAGCAAIAMAQVMNYYQYPSWTAATIPAYTTKTQKISMPAVDPTSIDWDGMRFVYGNMANDKQKNAVAWLVLLCGQSVEMDYGSKGSAAVSLLAVNALQNYFGYDKTVRNIRRSDFTASEWESLIYAEVAAERPGFYSGQSVGGGHGFVVDGYDGEGLFHINWGWGGHNDGYFRLSVLNPYTTTEVGASSSTDGFSFQQEAIVGIQHGTDEVANERLTVGKISASGGTTYTRSGNGSNFTNVKATTTCYNIAGITYTFNFGFALYDASGKMVGDAPLFVYNSVEMDNYAMFSDLETTLNFGAGLANGDYWIVPVSRTDANGAWNPCYGADVFRLKAIIDGETLTLEEPSVSLTAQLRTTGACEAGKSLPLTATVTNNGSMFNDEIYIFVDGQKAGARTLSLEGGATADFEIDFIPQSGGSKQVMLAYIKDNEYVAFAQTTVSVAAAATNSLSTAITVENLSSGKLTVDNASVKIVITNNGQTKYEQAVEADLMYYNEDDGYYYILDYLTQDISVKAGGVAEPRFQFLNVPSGIKAMVALRYFSNGKMTFAQPYGTPFDVSYTPKGLIHAKSLTLEGADANNVLQEPTAVITATVTNRGDANASYVPIIIELFRRNDSNGNYFKVDEDRGELDIPQGSSASLRITFDGLERGAHYKAKVGCASYSRVPFVSNDMELNFSVAPPAPVSRTLHIPQINHVTVSVARGDTPLADGDQVTAGDQLTITYTAESPYVIKGSGSNTLVETVTLTNDDFVSEEYTVKVVEVELPAGSAPLIFPDIRHVDITVARGGTPLAEGDLVVIGDQLTVGYESELPYMIKRSISSHLEETVTVAAADFRPWGDTVLDTLIDGAAQGFTQVTPEAPYGADWMEPGWPRPTGWFVHMPIWAEGPGSRTLKYVYQGTGPTTISYMHSIDGYFWQYGEFKMYCKVNGEVIESTVRESVNGATIPGITLLKDTITFNATGNDVIEWVCEKMYWSNWADDNGRPYFIGNITVIDKQAYSVKEIELMKFDTKVRIPQFNQVNVSVWRGDTKLADGDKVAIGDEVVVDYRAARPYLIKEAGGGEMWKTVTLSKDDFRLNGVEVLDTLIDGAEQGFTEVTPESPYGTGVDDENEGWQCQSGWFVHMPTYKQGTGSRTLKYVYKGTGPTIISYVHSIDGYFEQWGWFKMYCKVNGQVIASTVRQSIYGATISWQTLLKDTISFQATGNDVIEWVCEKMFRGTWADDGGRQYFVGNITVIDELAYSPENVKLTEATAKLHIPQADHMAVSVTRDGMTLDDGDEVNIGDKLEVTYTADEGYQIMGQTGRELVDSVTLSADDFKSVADCLIDTLINGAEQGYTEVTPDNLYGGTTEAEGWPRTTGWFTIMADRSHTTDVKTLTYTYTETGPTTISFVQNLSSPFIQYGKFILYCKVNGHISESTVHDYTVNPIESYETLLFDTISFNATGNDVIEWVCEKKGIGSWTDGGRPYYIGEITHNSEMFTIPAYEAELATLRGDVNLDGQVGIGDIVSITNVMAGIFPEDMDEEAIAALKVRADVNGDGEVGIGDIVTITNIMAGGQE